MTCHSVLTRVAFVLALTILMLGPSAAQVANSEQLPEPLAAWNADLERIEEALKDTSRDDSYFLRLRERLEAIREKTDEYASKTRAEHDAAKTQLDKLGPAPKPEDPPESEAAAKLRQDLTAKVAQLDGAIRAAGVLQIRAMQISGSVQEQRRKLFSRQLFKQVPSPLTRSLWTGVANYAATGVKGVKSLFNDWWYSMTQRYWLLAIFAGAILVWGLLHLPARRLVERYRSYEGDMPPPYLRRAAASGGATIARAVPLVAVACFLVAALWQFGMMSNRIQPLFVTAAAAFSGVIVLLSMIRTVLAPNQADWRVFPATDINAWRLTWLASGVAIIHGLDLVMARLNTILDAPLPLTVAQNFLTTVSVVILLALMLRVQVGRPDLPETEDEMPRAGTRRFLRIALWICVVAALAASFLGYIAFGRFLMKQVVFTGSLLILMYLLHNAIDDYSESMSDSERRAGRWLSERFELLPQRQVHLGMLASLLLHLVLLLVFVPLILVQWGFDWEDIRVWSAKAVFGFQIGDWQISLATILGALLVLAIGLLATRFFQNWLDGKVLERAQFEQGARSAIRTGLGYLGFAIAALLAVSFAGLDFSNLAIVAGALSVGIGFGLQSIVNNFVSGLILLAERRVSVGDWIVVGAEEGYVRRISVRATEIETFDRNFVIIPNAELMSNPVKNWTFEHRRARIVIDVGVGYGSDARKVHEILMECVNAHPLTIDPQKTRVFFETFGDSALIFRIRAFVGDVSDSLAVKSDLHFTILEKLREAGIEIPFPQRDVHLKGLEANAATDVADASVGQKPASRKTASAKRQPGKTGKRAGPGR